MFQYDIERGEKHDNSLNESYKCLRFTYKRNLSKTSLNTENHLIDSEQRTVAFLRSNNQFYRYHWYENTYATNWRGETENSVARSSYYQPPEYGVPISRG